MRAHHPLCFVASFLTVALQLGLRRGHQQKAPPPMRQIFRPGYGRPHLLAVSLYCRTRYVTAQRRSLSATMEQNKLSYLNLRLLLHWLLRQTLHLQSVQNSLDSSTTADPSSPPACRCSRFVESLLPCCSAYFCRSEQIIDIWNRNLKP